MRSLVTMSKKIEFLEAIYDKLKPESAELLDLNELNFDLLDEPQTEALSKGLDALFENCDSQNKISRQVLVILLA